MQGIQSKLTHLFKFWDYTTGSASKFLFTKRSHFYPFLNFISIQKHLSRPNQILNSQSGFSYTWGLPLGRLML